jgi:hypothetical protein
MCEGGEKNLSGDAKEASGLAGGQCGLASCLLLPSSNNLEIFLTPSRKIYNIHLYNVSTMQT